MLSTGGAAVLLSGGGGVRQLVCSVKLAVLVCVVLAVANSWMSAVAAVPVG